jgi:primosomal protein N' (replication factor Y)
VDRLREAAEQVQANVRILGPAEAPIAKLRGKYRFHSLLQAEDRMAMHEIVRQATADLKPPQEVQWVVDVDPLDLL